MNLIDAIKSGKPFHQGRGFSYDPSLPNWAGVRFSIESILATDWVVEEKSVTITKSQLEQAMERVQNTSFSSIINLTPHGRFMALARQLGLVEA